MNDSLELLKRIQERMAKVNVNHTPKRAKIAEALELMHRALAQVLKTVYDLRNDTLRLYLEEIGTCIEEMKGLCK